MNLFRFFLPKVYFAFGEGDPPPGDPPPAPPADPPPSAWYDALEPELKTDPSITKFKSVVDLAKGYRESQKLMGGGVIPIPGKDAEPKHWDAVYTKLGRPEKPEGYNLREGLQLPEGHEFTDTDNAFFANLAFKAGLNPTQAKALLNGFFEYQTQAEKAVLERFTAETNKATEALRSVWGASMEHNTQKANLVIDKLATDAEAAARIKQKFGNDPDLIRLLHTVSGKLSEGSLGPGGAKHFGLSPADADMKIKEIMGDANHPYNQKNHPRHGEAVAEMTELHRIAAGNS